VNPTPRAFDYRCPECGQRLDIHPPSDTSQPAGSRAWRGCDPRIMGAAKEVTNEELRDLLRANMFDGDEDGTVTMRVASLLDEVVAIIAEYAAIAEGTDALPVDLSDYMAGYRQAQADLTGLDAAPAEEPTE